MSDMLSVIKAELASLKPSEFDVIAHKSGVPLSTIRKVHYGEVTNPRIATVQALFDYFRQAGKRRA